MSLKPTPVGAFAISAGALPAGLTLNASTGAVSGTPTASGVASFTVRATDTLGNVGTRAYSVNIGTVSLTVNPSSLPASVVGRAYSQTVSATGGTAPYTFSVSAGSLPTGLTLNASSGVIGGTPTAAGAFSFTVQALDVNGNVGTRAFALNNRADPASDPEVQGLIHSQVAAARRFASTQIDNVTRHLEGLHDRFQPCGLDMGIALPTDAYAQATPQQPYYAAPGYDSRGYARQSSPAEQVARRSQVAGCGGGGWTSSFALWTSGAIQFGTSTPTGLTNSNRFVTAGLTAGIDLRLFDNLIVGAGIGYGSDRTDVGQNGTRSDAQSLNGVLYASFKAFDAWFIDAALGYGKLGYDNRRWVTADGTMVNGTRTGSYWFGSLGTSFEVKYGALKLAPYVRGDITSTTLEGYSEAGTSTEALTYGAMQFRTVTGTLGLRGSYDIAMNWGTLTPMARLEYRRALDGAYSQSMYYSDLGSAGSSVLNQASASRNLVTGSVGFRASVPGGMAFEMVYGTSLVAGAEQVRSLKASMKLPF